MKLSIGSMTTAQTAVVVGFIVYLAGIVYSAHFSHAYPVPLLDYLYTPLGTFVGIFIISFLTGWVFPAEYKKVSLVLPVVLIGFVLLLFSNVLEDSTNFYTFISTVYGILMGISSFLGARLGGATRNSYL